MKQPQLTSVIRVLKDIEALFECPEIQSAEFKNPTRELLESLLESSNHLKKELKFPKRTDLVNYLYDRIKTEDREKLVKRVMALIGSMPDEVLYSAYEAAKEIDNSK